MGASAWVDFVIQRGEGSPEIVYTTKNTLFVADILDNSRSSCAGVHITIIEGNKEVLGIFFDVVL